MKYTTKTIKVPLCEICEAELPDSNPRCEFDDGYYCGALFNHNDRVTSITQLLQGLNQTHVVSLM